MKPNPKYVGKPRKVWFPVPFKILRNGPVRVEIYHHGSIEPGEKK
jgi:hypothetical protein